MRVTYSREVAAKEFLDKLGIESFVPMHYEVTGQGDQSKYQLTPAIHNLIFVHSTQETLTLLKMTCRELEPLRYMMKPAEKSDGMEIMRVPDRQMENFMRVANASNDKVRFLTYEKFLDQPGQQVRITDGYFAGVEGVIKRIKNNKHVVVQIDGVVAAAVTFVPPSQLAIVS